MFVNIDVNPNEWTMVAENVSSLTFENIGMNNVVLAFSDSTTEPSTSAGLMYSPMTGELKKAISELSHISGAAYVFCRSISANGRIVIEAV